MIVLSKRFYKYQKPEEGLLVENVSLNKLNKIHSYCFYFIQINQIRFIFVEFGYRNNGKF